MQMLFLYRRQPFIEYGTLAKSGAEDYDRQLARRVVQRASGPPTDRKEPIR